MIDNVLNDLVDEIALEGEQGCTFEQTFDFIQTLSIKSLEHIKLNKPIQFDNKYKAYIWTHLRKNNQLVFTENEKVIDPCNLTFEEMQTKSETTNLAVKASEEAQDRNIYGSLWAEKKTLKDTHKLMLGVIAKSRSQGVSQFKLSEMYDWNPKMVFYYVKKLEQLGLVVKESVYTGHLNTRIILLKRFARSDQDQNKEMNVDIYRINAFENNLLTLLNQAKDNMMSLQDTIKSMGFQTVQNTRWARIKINKLHDQGVVEKFVAYDGKTHKQSVRIPRPNNYKPADNNDTKLELQPIVNKKKIINNNFFRDLPSDYQFYKDIVATGENGLVRQELIDKYPQLDPFVFQLFFENAASPPMTQEVAKYLIYRTEELNGKTRHFRYFDWNGWKKLNEKLGKIVEEPKVKQSRKSNLEEPLSIDYIGKSFDTYPTDKKQKKRPKKDINSFNSSEDEKPKRKRIGEPLIKYENSNTISLDIHSNKRKEISGDQGNVNIEKKRKKPSSELNSTKLRRHGILLDILEKNHVLELNKEAINEFNAIEMALTGGQKMALPTFDKMAKQLHEQKKIKIVFSTIQKYSGLNEVKTFLLHNSLTDDSEELKEYIANYNVKNTIVQGRNRCKEYKTVQVDQIPSIQEESPSIQEESLISNKERNLEIERIRREDILKYGWIKSKWIRARKLHENLLQFYINSNTNDPLIDMTEFIKHISMDTLIVICSGLPYYDDDFRKFLDVKENRSISFSEIPQNLQLLILKSKVKVRYFIKTLLDILKALGVIEFIHDIGSLNQHSIVPKCKILDQVVIRDYAFKDRKIIQTLCLKTLQDVNIFWDALYEACINPRRRRTKQDQIELEENIDRNDPLYNIYNSRGWITETSITPEQKEILDSFIDFKTKSIPCDSLALRMHLVKETQLSSKRIRLYYQGIVGSLEKQKKKIEKEAKIKAIQSREVDPTIKELMLVSLEGRKIITDQNVKNDECFVRSTFIGSRRTRKLRSRSENSLDRVFLPSRLPHNFSPLEKDLLLYGYCIMKTRAENSKFFWSPIIKLLTTRKKEQCRRVFNTMLNYEPDIKLKIERLKCQWKRYYREGIQSQKIQDENEWDTFSFDIRSFVEYFITRLQENSVTKKIIRDICLLPRTIQDLHKYYNIIRNERLIKAEMDLDLFSVNSFDQNMYDTPVVVTELQDDNDIYLVKTLIKMLLTTPDVLYEPDVAYSCMNRYPTSVIELALKGLREDGLIIKDFSRHSRIPGRSFNVSEKFLRISEGVIPFGIIDNSRAYHSSIIANKSLDLTVKQLNDGMVASVLDLLSQKKITLQLKNKEMFLKSKEMIFYPKRSEETVSLAYIRKHFNMVVQNTGITEANDINIPLYSQSHILIPTSEQITMFLKSMGLSQQVYQAVKSLEKCGGSFNEIKQCLIKKKIKLSDYDISNSIYNLVHHKPPLIHLVGFKQLRYVCTEFSPNWFLKTHDDKTFLDPLMWNDASGKVIESVLDGCGKAIVSHILTNPGISHANLSKRFRGFFTEYELYRLLKHLSDVKVIFSKKIQRDALPKKISIFNKRQLKCLSKNDGVVNCNEITFYWLSNDYYLYKKRIE